MNKFDHVHTFRYDSYGYRRLVSIGQFIFQNKNKMLFHIKYVFI